MELVIVVQRQVVICRLSLAVQSYRYLTESSAFALLSYECMLSAADSFGSQEFALK